MREVIQKKIEELGAEAKILVDNRDQYAAELQKIEVRLHQISGAISEMYKLLKDQDAE